MKKQCEIIWKVMASLFLAISSVFRVSPVIAEENNENANDSVTVIFDANGGTGEMENQIFTIGEEQALCGNAFTYDEHEFAGWNTVSDGSGESFADSQTVVFYDMNNDSCELFAQWIKKEVYTDGKKERGVLLDLESEDEKETVGFDDNDEVFEEVENSSKGNNPEEIYNTQIESATMLSIDSSDNYEYSLNADGTATITKYFGDDTSIEIPSSINGYRVVTIGKSAFSECSSLTNVTVPSGVECIDDFAFYYCKALRSIELPNTVTAIGDSVFEHCDSLTSIVIPDSVTSIGNFVFSGCDVLESVSLPNGVKSLGSSVFYYCHLLKEVNLPKEICEIPDWTFAGCNSLTSIEIPFGVDNIGIDAFYLCNNLTNVTIPEGVTSIGNSAFKECTKLETITIPSSILKLEDRAFDDVPLSTIYYGGTKTEWDSFLKNGVSMYNHYFLNRLAEGKTTVICEESEDTTIHVSFLSGIYPKGGKGQFPEMDIAWDFEWFNSDAKDFHIHNGLNIASLVLAANAYDETLLDNTMGKMGFTAFMSKNYDKYDDINRVGFGIGSTVANIDGVDTNVIAISCRGSAVGEDWESNLLQQASGFRIAANDVAEHLVGFITVNHIDLSKPTKFLVTGHSRGAAVANILGTILSDITPDSNIFVYTFACPNTTTESTRSQYTNIKNCTVLGDPVPLIPAMEGICNKFGRYAVFDVGTLNNFGNYFTLLTGVDKGQLEAHSDIGQTIAAALGLDVIVDNCDADYPVGIRYHAPATYMACLLCYEGQYVADVQLRYRITSVKCPVDVSVYKNEDILIGSITDNVPDKVLEEFGFYALIDDDEKYIYTFPDNDFSLKLTATDTGTMEYSVHHVNENESEVTEDKTFSDVSLNKGKEMSSRIAENIETKDVSLNVVDSANGTVIADIEEDGSEIDYSGTVGEMRVSVNGKSTEIAKLGLYNPGLPESFIKTDIKSGFSNAYSKGNNTSGNEYEIRIPKFSSYKLAALKPGFIAKVLDIELKESSELEVKLREYGDVDGNEEIDVADLSLTSGYILSDKGITDDNTEASDFNQDGVIDVADLAGISARILAG